MKTPLLVLVNLPIIAGATAPADTTALRDELAELRQKLAALERKAELKAEDDAAKEKTRPTLEFGDKGFAIQSADKANSIRFRGLVQTDARVYFDDGDAPQATDKFILRRARPIMEATLGRDYDIVLVPEFGVENPAAPFLLDAYLNAAPAGKSVQLQVGKQRSTIGLEMNQSDPKGFFTERALPTQLTSNRDVGVALHGKPFGDTLSYKVGVFNGAPDGASPSYNGEISDGIRLRSVPRETLRRLFTLRVVRIRRGVRCRLARQDGHRHQHRPL